MAAALTRLIAVPGHAIVRRLDAVDRDEGWYLKPYQNGEGRLFVEHIEAGVELAAVDPAALLVFCGGATDPRAGEVSEAVGYRMIAEHRNWFGHTGVSERTVAEEFSRDSFENLLFALCRFREIAGRYPEWVVVAGWSFKRERFHFHSRTLRLRNFEYIGVNDPHNLEAAVRSERDCRAAFERDPFGAGELASKRLARDPFRRQHKYVETCPEIAGLLAYQGSDSFPGALPWDCCS